MIFNRRVITKFLDLVNLKNHNDNFSEIATDLTDHESRITGAQSDITTHKASVKAHPAEHVTYSGSVAGAANVKQAVDIHVDSTVAHAAEHITYDGAVVGAKNIKDAMDKQKQAVDTLVVNGDSSPAAAQAKIDTFGVDQPTLKDRLDKDYLRTAAQLADNAKIFRTESIKVTKSVTRRAMFTPIDDDGRIEALTILKPWFDAKGWRAASAIITNNVGSGNYMSWSQINNLKSAGWEILSHTKSHAYLNGLTDAQQFDEISGSLDVLKANGFDIKGIVYPYGSGDSRALRLSRMYYNYGFQGWGPNTIPINSLSVTRYTIGEDEGLTLDNFKSYVDAAIANKRWMVLCSHIGTMSTAQRQIYSDLLDYIATVDIDVVTPSEGYAVFGNAVESRDYDSGKFTTIANDGEAYSSGVFRNFQTKYATGFTVTSPITVFDRDRVTMTVFFGADASGFPKQSAGILYTYRDVRYDDFSYQKWIPLGQNSVYIRFWNNVSNAWQNWKEYGAGVFTTVDSLNARTASDLAATYPAGAITHTTISGAGQGFPTSAGRLVTDRINSVDNGFQYQYWYPASSTDIQFRVTNSAGAWSAWEIIATKRSVVQNVAATMIPAHSSVDKILVANGTTINSLLQAHPIGGLEAGLDFRPYYYSDGNIVLRLINITAASITTSARDWQIVNG